MSTLSDWPLVMPALLMITFHLYAIGSNKTCIINV